MIALLLKASIVLAILLIFYKIFLEKESFFALNRFYLIGCLALAFMLPFVSLPALLDQQGIVSTMIEQVEHKDTPIEEKAIDLPKEPEHKIISEKLQEDLKLEDLPQKDVAENPQKEIKEESSQSDINLATQNSQKETKGLLYWFTLVYFFGVLIFSLNLLSQIANVFFRVIKSKDKIKDLDCTIISSTKIEEPCSFFNYIFINPESYDYNTYEQIIAHERIHVKQWHTLDLLISEIAIIILWFNPLIWLLRKEVEKNIEYQTDDLLLTNKTVEKKHYQMNLLKVASHNQPLAVTTNYNQSLIKQRILKMSAKKSNLYSYWKYAFIAPLIFMIVLLINKPVILSAQSDTNMGFVLEEVPENKSIEIKKESLNLKDNKIDSENTKTSAVENIDHEIPIAVEEEKEEALEKTVLNPNCDELEKAALAGDITKIRELLKTLDPDCLLDKNNKQLSNLEFLKSVLNNKNAKISVDTTYDDSMDDSVNDILQKLGIGNGNRTSIKTYQTGEDQKIEVHANCEKLEKAAKKGDLTKVKKLLLNYDLDCLNDNSGEQLSGIFLIKDLIKRDGSIHIEEGTGNITVRGPTMTIWSDDRHKAYRNAHNLNNISNPIKLDAYNTAIKESNELGLREIVKNLDPKHLYFQKEENFAHLKYMKYILNNDGKLTISNTTVYFRHDKNYFEVVYEDRAEIRNEFRNKKQYFTSSKCKKLIEAVYQGNTTKIKTLLKTIDPNCMDPNPQYEELIVDGHNWKLRKAKTPLVAAARKGYLEIGKLLVTAGAKITAYPPDEETPLLASAGSGSLDFVKYLLKNGAALNRMSGGYGTPLNAAARNGHMKVVKYLLDKGADIEAINNGQGTALNAAARNGHLEVVKYLLKQGANIEAINSGQGTALNAAARNGHLETVKYLLKQGANIEVMNSGQGTALNAAARNGHLETVKYLLSQGADIEAMNNGQGTALNAAARNGYAKTVKYLLEQGANVNAMNAGQNSALMQAAKNKHYKIVEILLKNGANPTLKPQHHESPKEYARKKNNRRLLDLFEKYAK